MSRSTISTFQILSLFPDEQSAYAYVEKRLWPKGPVCPRCKGTERIAKRNGRPGLYCCNPCDREFTVKVGTIFEDSHIPLRKWLYAMYLVVTARKGISSLQLAKELGVRQGTAWFLLPILRNRSSATRQKLSRAMKANPQARLGGLVGMTGKHHTLATKRRISEALEGRGLGVPKSEEHKRKLSFAARNRSVGHRQKLSLAGKVGIQIRKRGTNGRLT